MYPCMCIKCQYSFFMLKMITICFNMNEVVNFGYINCHLLRNRFMRTLCIHDSTSLFYLGHALFDGVKRGRKRKIWREGDG